MGDANGQCCSINTCYRLACFGRDGSHLRYCDVHKEGYMSDMNTVPNATSVPLRTCNAPGCNKQPSFGSAQDRRACFCYTHKLPGMVNVRRRFCSAAGCTKYPSYGLAQNPSATPNGRRADWRKMYCASHKSADMVNVIRKPCRAPGCNKQTTYGVAGSGYSGAMYCAAHKLPGMVNVVSKRCAAAGCARRPSFGADAGAESKAMYCVAHRSPSMINVNARLRAPAAEPAGTFDATSRVVSVAMSECDAPGCYAPPTHGRDNGAARYCSTHCPRDMGAVPHAVRCLKDIDTGNLMLPSTISEPAPAVVADDIVQQLTPLQRTINTMKLLARTPRQQCVIASCAQLARYSHPGHPGAAQYCHTHKLPSMVNRHLMHCSACTRPAMCIDMVTGVCTCVSHRTPSMEMIFRICSVPSCLNIMYSIGNHFMVCSTHQKMILCSYVDSVSGGVCYGVAEYGLLGVNPCYCDKHRLGVMVKHPMRHCSQCDAAGVYSVNAADAPRHCAAHRLDVEYNITDDICSMCQLAYLIHSEPMCYSCELWSYSKIMMPVRYCFVKNFVRASFPALMLSVDEVVRVSCDTRRPDFILKSDGRCVVIDCDEFQNYNADFEAARMVSIRDMIGTNVTFVRFNVSGYIPADGLCEHNIEGRCRTLAEWVSRILSRHQLMRVDAVYLYYNNWSSSAAKRIPVVACDLLVPTVV